jgi:hypothetical protein
MGERWVLSLADSAMWLLTNDPGGGQYVALHQLADLEATPYVLGKLPTRRSEPDFLLDRMIISSLLTGVWTDAQGDIYEFKSDATASWKGLRREVRIDVNPANNEVYMSLIDVRGDSKRFLAVRTGTKLTLTGEDGTSRDLKQATSTR